MDVEYVDLVPGQKKTVSPDNRNYGGFAECGEDGLKVKFVRKTGQILKFPVSKLTGKTTKKKSDVPPSSAKKKEAVDEMRARCEKIIQDKIDLRVAKMREVDSSIDQVFVFVVSPVEIENRDDMENFCFKGQTRVAVLGIGGGEESIRLVQDQQDYQQ